MVIVPSDIIDFLTGALKATFFEAYNKVRVQYSTITTMIPNTKTYSALSEIAAKEWTDERIPLGLLAHQFAVANKDWEASIALDRNALADDQLAVVKARINNLADEAARSLDQVIFEVLGGGFNHLGYDGTKFFADDHQEASTGIQSNLGHDELTISSYGAARASMMRTKDDRGRLMGVIPDTLVVPPALEETALQILNSDTYPASAGCMSGVGNPWKGSARLIVSPYLPSNRDWFLLCTSRAVRPIVLQMKKPIEFTALEENTESNFMRKTYSFGVDMRYSVGFGMWQFAYGSRVE